MWVSETGMEAERRDEKNERKTIQPRCSNSKEHFCGLVRLTLLSLFSCSPTTLMAHCLSASFSTRQEQKFLKEISLHLRLRSELSLFRAPFLALRSRRYSCRSRGNDEKLVSSLLSLSRRPNGFLCFEKSISPVRDI